MKRPVNILPKALALALLFGAGLSAHADFQSTVLSDNPSGFWRLHTPYTPPPPPPQVTATNLGSYGSTDDGVYSAGVLSGLPGSIVGDPDTSVDTTSGNIVINGVCSMIYG
jgi:hypothetical protein